MTTPSILNSSAPSFQTLTTDLPEPEPLLSAQSYSIIGSIFALLSLIGFLGNGCVLLVFMANDSLRSPTNLFIMALCISDLLMSLCSCIACAASFQHGWVFGETVCIIEGFSVYFLGLTSMYLLAAISLDRYFVIVRPLSGSNITKQVAIVVILVCWAFGFFWAALPLVGWNHYATEGVQISCSVVWDSNDIADFSYIITIFIFCLLIPLCLMIFSYVNIYLMIRGLARNSVWSANSRMALKNQRLERKMLKTAIVLVAVYIFSWLPYTVVSFMAAFGTPGVISPLMATLPALVAKSSGLWNPLVYGATNAQFRKAFLVIFRCFKIDSTDETKDDCETDHSMDASKVSKHCYSALETTSGEMKDSLTVNQTIYRKTGDTSPAHTSSEDLSPSRSLVNDNPETEVLEMSELSLKKNIIVKNRDHHF